MALDHYAPCPCGSGKKLKFCKCVDNLQELEKIIKLMDGEQEVAAIERINKQLSKTPNTAWLLALKGELVLAQQDLPAFHDTANRFLKLKPDNPLALIMKSVLSSMEEEPPEVTARYLLEGISEAREGLPPLTLLAVRYLLQRLVAVEKPSLSGYWASLLAGLLAEKGPQEDSPLLDPALNLLAKASTLILADPADAGWKERLSIP